MLTPCLRLPKKGADPDEKHMVVPAWAIKHKMFLGECNMSRVDFQVDVVNTFAHGDTMQHATSSVISLPVFRNSIAIDPGDELVVHWDQTPNSSGSKQNPIKTWKATVQKAPSQESVKIKKGKDLLGNRST